MEIGRSKSKKNIASREPQPYNGNRISNHSASIAQIILELVYIGQNHQKLFPIQYFMLSSPYEVTRGGKY